MKEIAITTNWWNDFFCTGGECPYTCCGGWNISVTDEEIAIYRRMQSNIPGIMEHIDVLSHGMRQKNGHCTLLTEDGWCSLVRRYGEASICATCQLFPRGAREYGNVIEKSVVISCPVVAQYLLDDAGLLLLSEDEFSIEDFTDEVYKCQYIIRDYILSLLADRNKNIAGKIYITLKLASWTKNAMEQGILNTKSAYDEVMRWYSLQNATCDELAVCREDYSLKSRMLGIFFSLYESGLKEWISADRYKERFVPYIFDDIVGWRDDGEALIRDMRRIDKYLSEKHPRFITTYLEQMVFMSFTARDGQEYYHDFFFRYIELMIIRLFIMSNERHSVNMSDSDLSAVIAYADRKLYYNDEPRRFISQSIKEIESGGNLDIFYFPAY